MDEGLFAKHFRVLKERSTTKENIISTLLEKTGVQIEESEITLLKKQINISTSSVKKAALFQKGMKQILEELGYSLKD